MSKKPRRKRIPNLPPQAFVAPQVTPAKITEDMMATPARPTANSSHDAVDRTAAVNWQQEYGAVLSDLKRTAILAGILLALMVALSIVVQ